MKAVQGPREALLESVLRESLLGHNLRPMQIDDNAARLLQIMTMVRRPKFAIELGTYFGYSTIHIARGLPLGGRLVTVEADPGFAAIAAQNLVRAGVNDRVEIVVADAGEYLAGLPKRSTDLIFIDADKASYPKYLKLCFPLLSDGGLLIADDAFASGDFRPESGPDGDGTIEVRAINSYNRAASSSPLLFSAFVGTSNGMLLSYRRSADPGPGEKTK